MTDLQDLRSQIDTINEQIVHLLDQRGRIALLIGKAKQGSAVYDPAREQAILQHVAALSSGPLPPAAIQDIFRAIIDACRSIQQPQQVAYLGPEGTYSQEAARQYAGQASSYQPYESIDQAAQAVVNGEVSIAVIPVENSTEGPVTRTLDLLLELPLVVSGEIMLPIHHQLLSDAKDLAAISEVVAHPQALAQCREWLDKHLPGTPRHAVVSNAQAAILASQDSSLAAIASKKAGEIYGLPPLAKNIHDNHSNTTRFLALSKTINGPTGNDKTSLICSMPNKPGSLHHALTILANHQLNMTKLESRPSDSGLWDYVFYIDVDGHQQDQAVDSAVTALRGYASFVKILGSYAKAINE